MDGRCYYIHDDRDFKFPIIQIYWPSSKDPVSLDKKKVQQQQNIHNLEQILLKECSDHSQSDNSPAVYARCKCQSSYDTCLDRVYTVCIALTIPKKLTVTTDRCYAVWSCNVPDDWKKKTTQKQYFLYTSW